ncbi:MAG: LamG-like jellyroll fold domain-containing protein [Kiritimatiellia bacterium]
MKNIGWKFRAAVALSSFAAAAHSGTVALWPLECDRSGAFDGRSLVDPAGSLTDSGVGSLSFAASGLDWQLPPNPDPYGHWLELDNRFCAVGDGTGGAFAKLEQASPALFAAMSGLGDFTVEGYLRVDAELDRGAWKSFFVAQAGGANVTLSLRHSRTSDDYVTEDNPSGYYYTFECYYRGSAADGNPGGDTILWTASEAEFAAAFPGVWRHLACTLDHGDTASTRLHFYVDGEEQIAGGVQVAKFRTMDNEDFVLYLGGRADHSLAAGFDYWRISDAALAPADLLCAGGEGTQIVAAPETTVAYWKLDPDANGLLDLRNSVGDYAHLRKNSFVSHPVVATDAAWSEPNAFEPVRGGRDGSGCATLQQPGMGLKAYNLGTELLPTNSFAVEGWYNPEQREGVSRFDTNATGRIFAVADPDRVWSLLLAKQADGSRVFALEAADDETKAGGAALADGVFSAVLPCAAGWHRLRLAYDAATGHGVWTLTFDDEPAGTVENVRAPVFQGAIAGANAYLGSTAVPGSTGRTRTKSDFSLTVTPRNENDSAFGSYDSWSVEKDGATVAVWPLDVRETAGNLWLDGRDTASAWHFTGTFWSDASFANIVCADDTPVVTNPDRSAAFAGDAAANGGSASVSTLATGRSFFFCDDPRVLELFGDGTKDMTFEYYQKRSLAMRDWEVVFTGDTESFGYGSDGMNFSQRSDGFKLCMRAMTIENDQLFADSHDRVDDVEQWHHIAMVRRYDPVTRTAVATLFQDGVECGSVSGKAAVHKLVCVEFFGRPSGNSLVGKVDELRLSAAALEPSQFLCAAVEPAPTPAETARKTMAYWELDDADGDAMLGNAIVPALALTGTATGSPDMFSVSGRIRNPDPTACFAGTAAVDSGSVNAATALVGAYAGACLEPTLPFTVEGWCKPAEPGAAGTVLFRATDAEGEGGWTLRLVRDGDAVRVALRAASPHSWTLTAADDVFAANLAACIGRWTHLAVVCDPQDGNGRWQLYVNGRAAGSIANAIAPGRLSWGLRDIELGSATGGQFDEWRLSRGTLTADDLLFRPNPGFALLLR